MMDEDDEYEDELKADLPLLHTQEPWSADTQVLVGAGGSRQIATTIDTPERNPYDLRRAAACVNACEGVFVPSDHKFAQVLNELDSLRKAQSTLQHQRAEVQTQFDHLEQQLAILSEDTDLVEKFLACMENKRSSCSDRASGLSSFILTVGSTLAEFQVEKANMDEQLRSSEERNKANDRRVKDFEKRYRDSQTELEKVSAQLTATTKKLDDMKTAAATKPLSAARVRAAPKVAKVAKAKRSR